MSFLTSLEVLASGLAAERLRVDLASANIANANSTRTPEGGPYRRIDPVLRARPLETPFASRLDGALRRVEVRGLRADPRPAREVFQPGHPDADENGIVRMPNVSVVEELVNLQSARRAYEANLAALQMGRQMEQRVLRFGRGG